MADYRTLDEAYLDWLYNQIGVIRNRNPARSYWSLVLQLQKTPYTWTVPNDDNRVEDGKDLRHDWVRENHLSIDDQMWFDLECSMLEMLIALSRRMSFETVRSSGEWFWKLLDNIGLKDYSDDIYDRAVSERIDKTLTRVIMRTYNKDGSGGLFPLQDPTNDQRKAELWYQMSAYLFEREGG